MVAGLLIWGIILALALAALTHQQTYLWILIACLATLGVVGVVNPVVAPLIGDGTIGIESNTDIVAGLLEGVTMFIVAAVLARIGKRVLELT